MFNFFYRGWGVAVCVLKFELEVHSTVKSLHVKLID